MSDRVDIVCDATSHAPKRVPQVAAFVRQPDRPLPGLDGEVEDWSPVEDSGWYEVGVYSRRPSLDGISPSPGVTFRAPKGQWFAGDVPFSDLSIEERAAAAPGHRVKYELACPLCADVVKVRGEDMPALLDGLALLGAAPVSLDLARDAHQRLRATRGASGERS